MADKEIDYIDKNDPALKAVNDEKADALKDSNKLYDDAVTANDKAIQSMINQNKAAADEAAKLQQEQTDFTIDKIEQQKDQAEKDYTKEQSASYVDWQKQSAKYGANAEAMADRGMANTGYSETAQVSMYNTYQNRVAVARDTFNRAKLDYDNGIKEAKLLNSSAIAKIKAEALAAQLEFTLQALQYKNTMLTQKASAALAIDQAYQSKYMDVYDQLYKEAALKEQARQFDAQLAEEKRQYDKTYEATYGGGSGSGGSSGGGGGGSVGGAIVKSKNDSVKNNTPQIDKGYSSSKSTTSNKATLSGDAKKYGTFSNGYQPKGISGHGKVTKTGQKVSVAGSQTKTGKAQTQNVWKAADGTLWYWNGKSQKYVRISSSSKSKTKKSNITVKQSPNGGQLKRNTQKLLSINTSAGKALKHVSKVRKGWI